MRKHFLILIAAGFFSLSNAQDSKFYAGVGLGYATAGGDVADELDLSGGLNINFLNLGYRINETWGVTSNQAKGNEGLEINSLSNRGVSFKKPLHSCLFFN